MPSLFAHIGIVHLSALAASSSLARPLVADFHDVKAPQERDAASVYGYTGTL